MLTGAKLADGFQAAHVSCDEGEDRDTNSTLYKNPDDGILEETGRDTMFSRDRSEEIFIVRSRQMCPDDEEGRDATKALIGTMSAWDSLND